MEVEADIEASPRFKNAIEINNAFKKYGRGNQAVQVLENLSMKVERGTIYGLLGPSGCGKSTILYSIVGISKLDAGNVYVLGNPPNFSDAIRKKIGYMPQDLSLYKEFKIKELLMYYGLLYGMKSSEISEKISFYTQFLDLPCETRGINTLSGGQKRRVSFAVALIHSPELLILDEPTVGVDPTLRKSIWNHLRELVSNNGATVLITTHYIEEARYSSKVGIMRRGRILAEDEPQQLMYFYGVDLLEDVVLELCTRDRERRKSRAQSVSEDPRKSNSRTHASTFFRPENDTKHCNSFFCSLKSLKRQDISAPIQERIRQSGQNQNANFQSCWWNVSKCNGFSNPAFAGTLPPLRSRWENYASKKNSAKPTTNQFTFVQTFSIFTHLMALLYKNYLLLVRNIGFLIFIFFVPSLQIVVICLAIGNDPKGLHVGVVNYEVMNTLKISNSSVRPDEFCKQQDFNNCSQITSLSCKYIEMLPSSSVSVVTYSTELEAKKSVAKGLSWGYMTFPANYSIHIQERSLFGNLATPETIEGSRISFKMDMTNKQIGQTLKQIFVETLQKYLSETLKLCGIEEGAAELPITFTKPLYGTNDTSFREFLAPSVLLGLIFFFPLCASSISYISEKKNGNLDRSIVAGVSTAEIMFSYLISQGLLLLGQSLFSFAMLVYVFGIEVLGSVVSAILLCILVGLGGMSMGFLVSTICNEEIEAVLLAIGFFFPNFILAGMVWPIEGMSSALQYISYLLPCTLACESMRSIISRGWSISHQSVWLGFISTGSWIVFYWVLTIVIFKYKAKR